MSSAIPTTSTITLFDDMIDGHEEFNDKGVLCRWTTENGWEEITTRICCDCGDERDINEDGSCDDMEFLEETKQYYCTDCMPCEECCDCGDDYFVGFMEKRKGSKSFTIQSYHRFFYTTNNEVPIKTDKGDRRNKIIRSSDEKIGDSEYFIALRAALNNDIVLRMIYEYLTSLDGLDIFHTLRIEQNEYQKTLSEASVPIPQQFLRHMAGTYEQDSELFTSSELLNIFMNWRDYNQIKYECDSSKLLRNLKLVPITGALSTKKTNVCNKTVIDFAVLRTHFNIGLDPSLVHVFDETDNEM